MVSSGKGDVGAEKLTGEVMDIMDRLPKLVQTMTGVDIAKVRNVGIKKKGRGKFACLNPIASESHNILLW